MSYNGLTNLGVEYLARMVAQNKPVTFTKIKVGNGSIPVSQTGNSTTNLYSLKKEVEILSKEQVENSIKLQILLNNLDLEEGFYVKELGVYVQDGREEKLYWYINKDNPSYLPDKNTPSTHRYNLFLEVSNIETNIINFTGQGLLADKKFVKDQITQAFTNFEVDYNETINNLNSEIKKKFNQGTVLNSLNSAEKIIQALQGNGGLQFDENLLYLNDAGTKKKGFYYLDKLKNGIFECLEQTTITVNDSSKFKDISNKSNSDRLDNLSKTDNLFNLTDLADNAYGAHYYEKNSFDTEFLVFTSIKKEDVKGGSAVLRVSIDNIEEKYPDYNTKYGWYIYDANLLQLMTNPAQYSDYYLDDKSYAVLRYRDQNSLFYGVYNIPENTNIYAILKIKITKR